MHVVARCLLRSSKSNWSKVMKSHNNPNKEHWISFPPQDCAPKSWCSNDGLICSFQNIVWVCCGPKTPRRCGKGLWTSWQFALNVSFSKSLAKTTADYFSNDLDKKKLPAVISWAHLYHICSFWSVTVQFLILVSFFLKSQLQNQFQNQPSEKPKNELFVMGV